MFLQIFWKLEAVVFHFLAQTLSMTVPEDAFTSPCEGWKEILENIGTRFLIETSNRLPGMDVNPLMTANGDNTYKTCRRRCDRVKTDFACFIFEFIHVNNYLKRIWEGKNLPRHADDDDSND